MGSKFSFQVQSESRQFFSSEGARISTTVQSDFSEGSVMVQWGFNEDLGFKEGLVMVQSEFGHG